MQDYLTIGRIGKTYGIKGWVKIHSFTKPYTKFLEYAPWIISFNHQQFPLSECKAHGNSLIGKIKHLESPEAVKHLVNANIVILKNQLPALTSQEVYWADLSQLDVYNLQDQYLGKIENLFETGANDVMVILKEKKKMMIPYVKDHIVKHIDLKAKKMIVDWQEDWL